ncbi:hypothetical protein [Sinorhizobium medicae]|uniref:hypothetical protein n=1 Tax=Sinorhizobium medicae TaxID=110321 RepID=UPI00129507E6|nr:hypothetical protein [Sinorhizobium medicae]
MHKVVRPFAYSVDGLTLVDLSVGDERDFGDLTVGLLKEGYIEPAAAAVEPTDEPVPETVNIEPRAARKRK